MFNQYDKAPMHQIDINVKLGLTEDLGNRLALIRAYKPYEIRLIDEYINDNSRKLTFRITAEKKTIDMIKELYNGS